MNKGFTLVELSAVMVILAILAVITAPLVVNVIKDGKQSSLELSAEKYLDLVNQAVVGKNLKEEFEPEKCEIKPDGNVICDEVTTLKINTEGKRPDGGVVKFLEGKIVSSEITYGTKALRMNEEGKIVQVKDIAKESTANIVYFDVSTGQSCKKTDYNEENSNTGYNGIDTKNEKQNSCLKFYILGENNNNTSNLILDHNTTAVVPWNNSGINTSGPSEVLDQLRIDTIDWQGTTTPTNYTKGSYTINYSGYKARLLTAEEVTNIVGHTTWDETVEANFFYLDSKSRTLKQTCMSGNTSECKYGWLYDRTSVSCKANGCLNSSNEETSGYWTATSKTALSTQPLHIFRFYQQSSL